MKNCHIRITLSSTYTIATIQWVDSTTGKVKGTFGREEICKLIYILGRRLSGHKSKPTI